MFTTNYNYMNIRFITSDCNCHNLWLKDKDRFISYYNNDKKMAAYLDFQSNLKYHHIWFAVHINNQHINNIFVNGISTRRIG